MSNQLLGLPIEETFDALADEIAKLADKVDRNEPVDLATIRLWDWALRARYMYLDLKKAQART